MDAADLTQEEIYALYESYGGCLDAKARSQLEHLLEEMAYPEQVAGDIRAEVGDQLYFPVLRALAALQAQAAAGAPEMPPSAPNARSAAYGDRKERQAKIIRDKFIDRREAGRYGELISRALKGTKG